MPEITVDLSKLKHNTRYLKELLSQQGFSMIGVTKVVSGNSLIVKAMLEAGIEYLGDSRIQNILKFKQRKIDAKYILIRIPSISEIPLVVQNADYSLNSELKVIKLLSEEALKQNKIHKIILMVDMGDLREGVNPLNIKSYIHDILKLKGIKLSGIGTNLKCFSGIIPTNKNMKGFSKLTEEIENVFGIKFKFVSGGNSANFNWFFSTKDKGKINNLRIGEALFLGHETIDFKPIPNLYTDVFRLTAEIIELKTRSLIPHGIAVSNAFGEPIKIQSTSNKDQNGGSRKQALLNIGRQDIAIKGLRPIENIKILGASSDYLIIDIKDNEYEIGDKINFNLNYEALLKSMTSPYITVKYKN